METKLTLEKLKQLAPSWSNLIKAKYSEEIVYIYNYIDHGDIYKAEAWCLTQTGQSLLSDLRHLSLLAKPKITRKVFYRYINQGKSQFRGLYLINKKPEREGDVKIKITVME